MKKSLVIFLSLALASCANENFNDKPPGWNCTFLYVPDQDSQTGFYCNGMKYPESRKFFHYTDPLIQKARAMPKETAERYETYLRDKFQELKNKCSRFISEASNGNNTL